MSSQEENTKLIEAAQDFEKGNIENSNEEKNCTFWENLYGAIWDMVGMFFFVLCIYYNMGSIENFAFGFWVILIMFGKFSGSHLNPAVSLGCYIYDGKFIDGLPKLFMYIVAQFIGAWSSVMFCKAMISDNVTVLIPTQNSIPYVMVTELFFTGTFILVILFNATQHTQPSKSAPLNMGVIIAWFYVIVKAGTKHSGAAYNPAILTALILLGPSKEATIYAYLSWMCVGQLIGGVLFAFLFKYVMEAYYIRKYVNVHKHNEGKQITA